VRIDEIAEICHVANIAYCRTIGENSHQAWDAMSDEHKDAVIAGVNLVYTTPDVPLDVLHANWIERKRKDGWTVGLVKSRERKQDSNLVPWDRLPAEQRLKYVIFKNTIKSIMSKPIVVITEEKKKKNAS
jgi:hypothetical protein